MEYTVLLTDEASKFIESLNTKMKAKVFRTIGLLKEFGYNLPEPHTKKIQGTKQLHELRVKLGTDICRLFFFITKIKPI